jgi:hypothetical protein
MGGSKEAKFDHPTQKPFELMLRPILNHTVKGEAVYDPFLGSGTTLIAAEVTERVCCGMELTPSMSTPVGRWQVLSGKYATLEGDGGRSISLPRTAEEEDRVRGEEAVSRQTDLVLQQWVTGQNPVARKKRQSRRCSHSGI